MDEKLITCNVLMGVSVGGQICSSCIVSLLPFLIMEQKGCRCFCIMKTLVGGSVWLVAALDLHV